MATSDDGERRADRVTPLNPSVEAMAMMALNLIDLRAHFEAQLRAVGHAEEMLVKCRAKCDSDVLTESMGTFRQELARMVSNNGSIQGLLAQLTASVHPSALTGS